jgi:hypothetical protein
VFVHCDICRTFEHQLRHYEVEIKTRIEAGGVPPADCSSIAIGESLDELKEEHGKTKALYARHREKGHGVVFVVRDLAGAAE